MGLLYLANPSSAFADFQVNGAAIMPGRPFAPGPRPPFGTPWFVTATIARYPEPTVVGYGTNVIDAAFHDQQDDGHTFTFVLPGELSIDDDLVGYAFRGALLLMTGGGRPLPANPCPILSGPTWVPGPTNDP